MHYLGIGKTLYHSSVTLLNHASELDFETILTERILRSKHSGKWPARALEFFSSKLEDVTQIGESRDVSSAREYEDALEKAFPFYDFLRSRNLTKFSSFFNSSLKVYGHHLAHAYAALAFSPFDKALIVVLDGAGSSAGHLRSLKQETVPTELEDHSFEYLSVYLQDRHRIALLRKEFLTFQKGPLSGRFFGRGIGLFYEAISEFIFQSKHATGKVMGLAPFGTPIKFSDHFSFLDELDWSLRFQGRSKEDWESSPHQNLYRDLAATAQTEFESYLENLLHSLRQYYPDTTKLILTGGCALNCTANWKVFSLKLFDEIHVLPFPGDESIGLGCAYALFHQADPLAWRPFPQALQTSFYGPRSSHPDALQERELFHEYKWQEVDDIASRAAREMASGKIIAWFQGRSECGPRALGHRSILACPDRPNLKVDLNQRIKFREDFRPYGCTVVWEKAHHFFETPPGFFNSFMSFAVPVKKEWSARLKHVTHIDGTSRMQTLTKEQDPLFYELLIEVEKSTGLPIVLNTSLNVMGEPIVETVDDALRFLKSSPVDGLCFGNFWIERRF